MYEVEVKVRADHDAVRERLAELDATPLGTFVQVDTYYGAPHRDFAETDEALRVREVADAEEGADPEVVEEADSGLPDYAESRVAYKGPLVGSAAKTREEVETTVADGAAIRTLLDRLGFEPVASVRKVREEYALDDYTVTLDDVADLGTFVEVEREATETDVDAVREGAFEVLSRLGLDADESIRTSYLELLLARDN